MSIIGEAFIAIRPDTDGFARETESRVAGGLGKVGRVAGAAALGAGTAAVGAAAAGVKAFGDLESGMNEVFTLMPGITQDAMGEMTGDVRDFSREMGTVPNEVVPALYQSLSAGVPPDNVFEFLETANKAALGGVTELDTAVDGISSVVNAYGDQIGGASEASDLMFTAVRRGKTTFDELSGSLFQVIPTASSLGVGFGDITGALASMTAQGTPTRVATTQLRQLFVELSKDGGKASEAFKEAAGVGLKQFIDEGGNTADALDIMQQAADDNGVAINDMFGSVEAGNAALALSGQNAEGYRENLAEMEDAAGATDAAHERMDTGLARTWERIKTNVMVALGEIGEELAPTFQRFGDWVVENLPAITDFIVGAFKWIATFVRETLVPAFQGLKAWWDTNGPAIISAVQTMWAGIRVVFDALVGAWQWVVSLFEGGSGETSETMQKLRDTFAVVWEAISLVVTRAVNDIGALIEWLTDFGQMVWERWGEDLMAHAQVVWESIQKIVGGVLDVIKGIFEVFIGVFTGDWTRAWEGVKSIFSGVWDIIVGLWDGIVSGFKTSLRIFMDVVGDLWSRGWNAVRDKAAEILASVVATVSGKLAEVTTFFRNLPGRIRSALGDLSGKLWSAGRELLAGLISGITSKVSGAVRAVRNAVSDVVSGAKGMLGIRSPSTVFADEVGEPIMAGLVKGIESMADDPAEVLNRLLGQLASMDATLAPTLEPMTPVESFRQQARQQARQTGDDGAAVRARDIATSPAPMVGTMNLYTVDPQKSGDEVLRALRERAYLGAPLGGNR